MKAHKKFEPLFKKGELKSFDTREYNARLLAGEDVRAKELGIREFVLESGRVSGKTKHDEMAAVIDLISREKGDVWYCRSEDNTIRTSIFTGILNTINEMGFSYGKGEEADFSVSFSPFLIKCNRTGNVMQFFAINKDINRTKGRTPPSGVLKRVMVEEANECDDGIYIDALVTTAIRYFNSQSVLTFRLNPPLTKQHWSVAYFASRVAKGATRIYTTWEDLAKEGLLPSAVVAEILKVKASDELYYRYWYLGQMVNMQGLVFPHFDRDKHIVSADYNRIAEITSDIIIAGDAANKNDATAFGLMARLKDGRLLLLDAFYFDPQRAGYQTDDIELARLICDWYERVVSKYPSLRHKRHVGIVDNANWNLTRMLEKSKSLYHVDWNDATDKSVLRDTNRLRGIIREDLLLINADGENVEDVMAEIENYIYDPKTNDIKKNQKDHAIDMLKYATLVYADTTALF